MLQSRSPLKLLAPTIAAAFISASVSGLCDAMQDPGPSINHIRNHLASGTWSSSVHVNKISVDKSDDTAEPLISTAQFRFAVSESGGLRYDIEQFRRRHMTILSITEPIIASDGERLYLASELKERFVSFEAASPRHALMNQLRVGHASNDNSAIILMRFLEAIDPENSHATIASVNAIESETIDGNEQAVVKLAVSYVNGPERGTTQEYTLWISANRPHQLTRLRTQREYHLPAITSQLDPDNPSDRAVLQHGFDGPMSWIEKYTLTFSDWKTGDDVDADFDWTPPDDYTEVRTPSDLFSANPREPLAGEPADLKNEPAPAFSLESLEDEEIAIPDDHAGEIIILDFWATWCAPCVRLMPDLIAVEQQYREQGVHFYAVNRGERAETIAAFLESKDWAVNVLRDTDGDVAEQYFVHGIPQTVVIDQDGVVRAVHTGYTPERKSQLKATLDELLR